jgi:hypothetical protein
LTRRDLGSRLTTRQAVMYGTSREAVLSFFLIRGERSREDAVRYWKEGIYGSCSFSIASFAPADDLHGCPWKQQARYLGRPPRVEARKLLAATHHATGHPAAAQPLPPRPVMMATSSPDTIHVASMLPHRRRFWLSVGPCLIDGNSEVAVGSIREQGWRQNPP